MLQKRKLCDNYSLYKFYGKFLRKEKVELLVFKIQRQSFSIDEGFIGKQGDVQKVTWGIRNELLRVRCRPLRCMQPLRFPDFRHTVSSWSLESTTWTQVSGAARNWWRAEEKRQNVTKYFQ